MTRLTLLGTGGGRFTTVTQERATGGLYIEDGISLHVDPGPGAIIQMRRAKLDPMRTDGILVSHCHPDHYTDAEMLLEAMTNGARDRGGLLAASLSVLEGHGEIGPAISRYHQSVVERVIPLKAGDSFEAPPISVTATPASHSDPSTVGFRISTTNGDVGYVADTALEDAVVEANRGVRVLILPLTRPLRSRIDHHLCTEDAAELAAGAEPELVVLTHLGLKLLREDPELQADWISKKSGARTVVGQDLMRIYLRDRISMRSPRDDGRGRGRAARSHGGRGRREERGASRRQGSGQGDAGAGDAGQRDQR